MGILRNPGGNYAGGALVFMVLALLVFAVGCTGDETGSAESGNEPDGQAGETNDAADQGQEGETTDESDARGNDGQAVAGDATVRSDGTVIAGDVTVGPDGEVSGPGLDGGGDEGSSGGTTASEATLRMEGDAGTTFSGTCLLGEEEIYVSGEVPKTFDLRLEGRGLDCEIRKDGEGRLRMVLESGNSRNVYQSASSNATVRLTYAGNGIASFSSSSSGSSSSVIQQNSSSTVIQQQSSR